MLFSLSIFIFVSKQYLLLVFVYNQIFILGTGTFGRVLLCRNKHTNVYGAMKILALADVIRLKQVEHVKNERNILQEINHPFIVNL